MLRGIVDAVRRLWRPFEMPPIPIPHRDDHDVVARVAEVRRETQNVLRAAELVHRAAATGQWSTDLMANRRGRGEWQADHP